MYFPIVGIVEPLYKHLSAEQLTGDFSLKDEEVLDVPFKKKVFREARVTGGSLTCSVFEDCTFINTIFENIYLDEAHFVRCSFEDFRMVNCSHDAMEIRECVGSPPTIIGTKEPMPGWENQPFPPGWGPSINSTK